MDEELVIRINNEVNSQITYMRDIDQYGIIEKWVINPSSNLGDCEDYALTKLSRLVQARFSAARCSIKVVRILSGPEAGQLHAVLVIDRIWVLDNRFEDIRRLADLPYRVLRSYP